MQGEPFCVWRAYHVSFQFALLEILMQTRRDVLLMATPLALLSCFAVMTGCQSSPRSDMGLMNSRCPMKPDCPLPASPATVNFKGGKVGFCCKGCIDEWSQMNEAQQEKTLAKVR